MSDSIYDPGGIGKTPKPLPLPIVVSSWDDYKKAIKILGLNNFDFRCNSWDDFYKISKALNKITKENN